MAQLALVYDPRMHTFESWSALMCEAYAAQQLQVGVAEEDWKDWAVGLKAIDLFANESIPGPYVFDDWQDWAEMLVAAVNPKIMVVG